MPEDGDLEAAAGDALDLFELDERPAIPSTTLWCCLLPYAPPPRKEMMRMYWSHYAQYDALVHLPFQHVCILPFAIVQQVQYLPASVLPLSRSLHLWQRLNWRMEVPM